MDFSPDIFSENARQEGHSDDYIKVCLEYAENLYSRNLPVIFSPYHLARHLHLNFLLYPDLLKNRSQNYRYFQIGKRRGGKRPINSPNSKIKTIQYWILTNILEKLLTHDAGTGYKKGTSIIKNAAVHQNSEMILKIDLKSFFDSIYEPRVYGLFKEIGYESNVAVDLAKLCTAFILPDNGITILANNQDERGFAIHASLPQGAPTSPILSNLIGYKLDSRLSGIAKSSGCRYSRYSDDLTFSGKKEQLPALGLIKHIVREENFIVNNEKTRYMRKGTRQIVTGISVANGLHVPKKYKKELWRHLHICQKFGPKSHLLWLNKKPKENFADYILGKIMFVRQVEPTTGDRMLAKFQEVDWGELFEF